MTRSHKVLPTLCTFLSLAATTASAQELDRRSTRHGTNDGTTSIRIAANGSFIAGVDFGLASTPFGYDVLLGMRLRYRDGLGNPTGTSSWTGTGPSTPTASFDVPYGDRIVGMETSHSTPNNALATIIGVRLWTEQGLDRTFGLVSTSPRITRQAHQFSNHEFVGFDARTQVDQIRLITSIEGVFRPSGTEIVARWGDLTGTLDPAIPRTERRVSAMCTLLASNGALRTVVLGLSERSYPSGTRLGEVLGSGLCGAGWLYAHPIRLETWWSANPELLMGIRLTDATGAVHTGGGTVGTHRVIDAAPGYELNGLFGTLTTIGQEEVIRGLGVVQRPVLGTTRAFGTGCASNGAAATPDLHGASAAGPPITGNIGYALELTQGPAHALTAVMISPAMANVPFSGCTLFVDPSIVLFLLMGVTDANGSLSLSTPMPSDPALIGLYVAFQTLSIEGSGLAFSNGLNVGVGIY